MRIDYLPPDLDEPAEVVEAIRARRGGQLAELDRMLLHSPAYAAGWNRFLGAVRAELTVPQRLAELAICYVAVLNGADYELAQHGPLYINAGGSEELLALLSDDPDPARNARFDPAQQKILRLTREMTRDIAVGDETFTAARALFDHDETMVEMVGIIAAYNMVSRFLVALQIEP